MNDYLYDVGNAIGKHNLEDIQMEWQGREILHQNKIIQYIF